MNELDFLDEEWRRLDDELSVLRWRTERLIALGYELREAAFLAISGVDIHELERLIGRLPARDRGADRRLTPPLSRP